MTRLIRMRQAEYHYDTPNLHEMNRIMTRKLKDFFKRYDIKKTLFSRHFARVIEVSVVN